MTSRRRPLAWFLLLALLFAQAANAAYACAREASVAGDGFAAFSTLEKAFEATPDCEPMQATAIDDGVSASPLCVNHCTHDTQATADANVPVLHWLPATSLGVFLVLPAIDPAFDALAFSETPGMGRSIAPAVPILLGRFLS